MCFFFMDNYEGNICRVLRTWYVVTLYKVFATIIVVIIIVVED